MIIEYSPHFKRAYKKLDKIKKEQANKALTIFTRDPFEPRLKNHKLGGNLSGVRAFSAAYDLRILYREKNGHAYVLLMQIGRHDDVY